MLSGVRIGHASIIWHQQFIQLSRLASTIKRSSQQQKIARANFSPNSGVLTVGVKHRCLIEVSHGRGRLVRCYLQYIHASRNPRSAFRLRRVARSAWPRRVLLATALLLWSLFVAGARGSSCFGGPRPTSRDRRKGSQRLYFEMQSSWQV